MTEKERMLAAYKDMNALWPANVAKPSGKDAIVIAKKLIAEGFRRQGKKAPTFKRGYTLTSGNRHTWSHRGEFRVNPDRYGGGLRELVHGVSHFVHNEIYPNRGGHDTHLPTERHLIEYAIAQGFHLPKAAPAPKVKPDVKAIRAARVEARIKAWETKAKRAKTALAKLYQQRRYYARQCVAPQC